MSNCDKACGCDSGAEPLNPEAATSRPIGIWESLFSVPKMDCPSEERMIRLALDGSEGLESLSFDLAKREVTVYHNTDINPIAIKLEALGLGAKLLKTTSSSTEAVANNQTNQNSVATQEGITLKTLLAINAIMFVAEISVGVVAKSTGLIADSLDMFADAAVYGLALYAVGKSKQLQLRSAHLAGYFQLVLALGVLIEVARRFIYGSEPVSLLMMVMGGIALIANVSCLWLISGHRKGGAHMKASWIFSANDVLANLGVIIAGILVAFTGSAYPDLIIGTLIGLLVLNGARRILMIKN